MPTSLLLAQALNFSKPDLYTKVKPTPPAPVLQCVILNPFGLKPSKDVTTLDAVNTVLKALGLKSDDNVVGAQSPKVSITDDKGSMVAASYSVNFVNKKNESTHSISVTHDLSIPNSPTMQITLPKSLADSYITAIGLKSVDPEISSPDPIACGENLEKLLNKQGVSYNVINVVFDKDGNAILTFAGLSKTTFDPVPTQPPTLLPPEKIKAINDGNRQ